MAQKQGRASTLEVKRASLTIPKESARNSLLGQVEKGKELLKIEIKNKLDLDQALSAYNTWNDYNHELLRRIVDNDDLVNSYHRQWAIGYLGDAPFSAYVNEYYEDVNYCIQKLESILHRLDLIPESTTISGLNKNNKYQENVGNKIFIVHGHDEESKLAVARCIERLSLVPIILHEQPNQGRTIIEKFEDYAGVSFAIILLTPDDVGASKINIKKLSPRARQNVILELGFFIGKLGRNKVCALHKGDLELPSDISGVIWEPLDEGGAWMLKIGKEMKAAGLDIDLNKLA